MTAQIDSKELHDRIDKRIWALGWVCGKLREQPENVAVVDQLLFSRLVLIDILDIVESGDLDVPDTKLLEARFA